MIWMEVPDEKELVKQCLAQDKKAWDTFVEQYSRLITHAIAKTLDNYSCTQKEQVVPDLYHSVFISLIENNCKKLRQFQWRCSLSSWLYLIAVRVTVDYLRSQKESASLNGGTPFEDSLKERIPNGNPLADCVMEMEEEKRLFQKIKEGLTSKERFFVELYYTRELSPATIAKILKTSENNVYQLKSRVRDKMKEIARKLL